MSRDALEAHGEPWTQEALRLASMLSKRELAAALSFSAACATCEREKDLREALRQFGAFIGFEFLLYAYMSSSYSAAGHVCVKNLSNPARWMKEYERKGYLEHDPVRRELEVRLAAGQTLGVILWDAYERDLSGIEQEIIARRSHHGLRTGFSAFCDSSRHDAVFLASFATARTTRPRAQAMLLGELVVAQLNRCQKRLDLRELVGQLTTREREVARWLLEGKTNAEIAQILEVTEATAKYHVANILTKLGASGRQGAVAMLIAERCLA